MSCCLCTDKEMIPGYRGVSNTLLPKHFNKVVKISI